MISICILANPMTRDLQSCLTSIDSQTYRDFEIILQTTKSDYRGRHFQTSQFPIVLFLDQDCCLPDSDYLQNVVKLFSEDNTRIVIGGRYVSRDLKNSYNELCNCWLERGTRIEKGKLFSEILLGGCFAIHRDRLGNLHIPWPLFWGGEDALVFKYLRENGFNLEFHPFLNVFHNGNCNLIYSAKRAFLHGQRKAQFDLGIKSPKAIPLPSIVHWPFFIWHFAFLKLGEWIKPQSCPTPYEKCDSKRILPS